MKAVKDGTVKQFAAGALGTRWFDPKPRGAGFYVMWGEWKGPFADQRSARSAYAEWAYEAKHS